MKVSRSALVNRITSESMKCESDEEEDLFLSAMYSYIDYWLMRTAQEPDVEVVSSKGRKRKAAKTK